MPTKRAKKKAKKKAKRKVGKSLSSFKKKAKKKVKKKAAKRKTPKETRDQTKYSLKIEKIGALKDKVFFAVTHMGNFNDQFFYEKRWRNHFEHKGVALISDGDQCVTQGKNRLNVHIPYCTDGLNAPISCNKKDFPKILAAVKAYTSKKGPKVHWIEQDSRMRGACQHGKRSFLRYKTPLAAFLDLGNNESAWNKIRNNFGYLRQAWFTKHIIEPIRAGKGVTKKAKKKS